MGFESVRINVPDVVHDAMDGEVVVVNLKNGRYYSLADSAAAIWACLDQNLGRPAIVRHLQAAYEGDASVMDEAVGRFMSELESEGLIVAEAGPAASAKSQSPPAVPASRTTFQPPTLAKHVDMEALLLLDPVHEVSPEGWPNRKT